MKDLKEYVEGYADLKRQVAEISKRMNALTKMEVREVEQNGTSQFKFSKEKIVLSLRGRGGDKRETNNYNDKTENIANTNSQVENNSNRLSTFNGALQKLLDETYGGDSSVLPWDTDLYGQASEVWAFEGTVDGPLSSPNEYNLKFYLVGSTLYGSSYSVDVGAGTGVNIFNNYVQIVGVDTTWMNVKLNDRGLSFTSSETKGLASGTYNVRWYDLGATWEVDFNVTVP